MELRFIDNNTPLDRHSKKLVKSHAMRGKNAGKTFSRGHRGQQREKAFHSGQPTTEPNQAIERVNRRRLPSKGSLSDLDIYYSSKTSRVVSPINYFSGAEWSHFATPIPLTPLDRYLFHELHRSISQELYPQAFCRLSREAETSWFECVIADPCAFHCGLAMTGAHRSRDQGHRDVPPESIRHFSQTIRLLRRGLNTASEPQDASVAVAISLAVHANLTGAAAESRIHLQGLKRMIELRPGGLAALCSAAPELGNKIRRADLELALSAGTPTVFGSQPSPLPVPPCFIVPLDGRGVCDSLPHPLDETCAVMQCAARDVLALCSYAGSGKLGAFQYQDVVISIFQRLIDYAPLDGPRPLHALDDLCQLGLLAFTCNLVHRTRKRQSVYSALPLRVFGAQLRLLDHDLFHSEPRTYRFFYLWLFFVYAMTAPDFGQCSDAGALAARQIRALAEILNLETWDNVVVQLGVYPWTTTFHDELGREVWESITCNNVKNI